MLPLYSNLPERATALSHIIRGWVLTQA